MRYLQEPIWLCFIGRHFADEPGGGESTGDREPCFFADLLSQFTGIFTGAEEFLHTGKVDVEFVDGCFFEQGDFGSNDLGDPAGVLAIVAPAAVRNHGMGTELQGSFHRHRGVNTEFPGLVAAGGNDTAFIAANQYGFAFQGRVVYDLD